MRSLKRWGVAVIAVGALALGCFGEFPTTSGGSPSPQAAQASPCLVKSDCGGGGGQSCGFTITLPPNTWIDNVNPCGANNWRSISVFFDYPPPPSACTVSIGLDATGLQASRCNEGSAFASQVSGIYGGTFAYNTSPLWVTATGAVSTQ